MFAAINYQPVAVAAAFANIMQLPAGLNAQMMGVVWGDDQEPNLAPKIEGYVLSKDMFNVLGYAWNREFIRKVGEPRRGVWIGGPKGAGKTTGPEQFFSNLGVPVVTITCNRRIPLSDYISKVVPNHEEGGWRTVSGPLKHAMECGYPVILNEPSAMDEADLVAMHDIIDRGFFIGDDGVEIRAARGFMVFATDNTMGYGDETGAHAGTNALNTATMRRFLKLQVDYPSAEEELAILSRKFPAQSKEALEAFIRFANAMREPYRQNQTHVTMGTGELIDWVEASSYFKGMPNRDAAWFAFKTVMGGLPEASMEQARMTYRSTFGVDVSDQ
ncbi:MULTISPECIES: AAA family ATPase [Stenotrophomonas]|uniref:AAA family ATPase n=1 Tax=Stenotrophomonas TaxID=40323 RepID=UPI0021C5D838|nr:MULTISPECIES: AAA family ATPase [Stenotrophomonas]MCU1136965.1 AAA family ATPase [Stenotrophomonas maltophilia]MEC4339710.1 AAA family ATPase [Stenotrophomonas pavanii]